MKQSSRAWILLILGIFLCASLLVAKTPEVQYSDPAGLAPRSLTTSTSTHQPTQPQTFRTDVAYGYNAYDPSGALSDGPVTFELDSPDAITLIQDQSAYNFIAGSSTDYDGNWWGLVYSTNELVTIDPETGDRTVIATATAPGGRSWTGMAYDFTTMTMYAICFSSGVDAALCTIDLDTYEVTLVGATTDITTPIALACSNEGDVYTVDIADDNLKLVDKTDGSAEIVGYVGFDCIYAQDMEFDHEDNTLWWASYSTQGELRTINIETGQSTLIGMFQGGAEITGFAIFSIPADPGAPAAPSNLVITPNAGGALSCALSWTNPSTDFEGNTLTELTGINIYRNDMLVHTVNNPTIGANASWTDNTMAAPLMAYYRILGVNSFGEGVPVTGNAWVGEDVPAAVTDLTLVENNYNGRLTWVNPTTGMHGGPYNNPITGYHLVRSDGEVIDITGIMTMYDDTTIEFGGTYSYEVSPVNASGIGAPAVSNSCMILTPGTMVYADFEGGVIPEGWTQENIVNDLDWVVQTGGYSGNPEFANNGEYNACLYESGSNGTTTRLISPVFNITQGAVLTFAHTQAVWAGDQDNLTLLYRNTPGGTWTQIQTWTEDISAWQSENFVLPNASTTYQLAFEGLVAYGYGVCLDDIIVSGEAGDVGTIEGTVTLDGGSGVITEVEVEAGGVMVHPNQSGDYAITLAVGTYDVTASLFGYSDVVVEGVDVVADQVTDGVDITLVPNPNVTVTGRCVGSDYPDVGLANVQIDITGYDTYQAFTNADGYFTIEGVWANHTYQLTAMVTGYDVYIGEAIVGDNDVDLGDIILPEIASPPYNLIATQNDEGTIANLIWRTPTGSLETVFNFDNDDCDFVSNSTTGWQWGEDTGFGYNSEPNVWATVLNGNYVDNADWTLDSPEVMIATDDYQLTFWHNVDTENSWDGGNVSISIDGGNSWTVITPIGGYPDDEIVGLDNEPGFTDGPTGWQMVTFELEGYEGEDAMFRWHFGTDGSVNTYPGWAIDDVRIGMPEERLALQQDNDHLRWVSNMPNRDQRIIEGYSVYRLLLGDEDNEVNWDLVNGAVSDTTYADATWEYATTNIYKYAVKANYTNGIYSDAAVSDWLAKNYYTTCLVNVNSATGDPLEGTLVRLSCQETDPDGEYPEYEYEFDADDTSAYFPMVWLGTYEVSVMLEGAEPVVEIHNITTPTEITITLTELTPPVNGLEATVTGNDVTLMWRTPSNSTEYNFDDDDGEFISNNAAGWQWGEDANMGSHSEPNVWGTVLNGNYENSCNYILDSPEITVGGNNYLTFWHYYNTEGSVTYTYDAGNVKISVDGGDTWTVIEPDEGYPSPAAYTGNGAIPGEPCYFGDSGGWVQANFNLEEYAGSSAMFRWSYGSDSSVNSYYGWYIDDVYVGVPQDDRATDNNVTRREARRTDRSLEGYTLYRNGSLLDDTLTPQDTVYVDMDLVDGVYTYDVIANYTTGDSQAETITVQVYPVTITGYVNTTDHPDDGLTGALVILQNDLYYFEVYTVDGNFSFVDVNGMQTYTLTITYDGGDSFYDMYETELTVADLDINLGTITLIEQTPAPGSVIATESTDHTQVDLIWGTPGSATPTEFRYDDGTITGQLGYGSGGTDVRLGAAHYHDARIEEITWMLTDEGGPHAAVDLYIYGLDGSGMPDGLDELFSITGVANTDAQWNTLVLDTPVDAPNGFFLCANYPSGFIGLGTDDGVGDPYPYIAGTQLVTNAVTTNDWHDPNEYGYPYNFAIRAIGLDYGEIEYRSEYVSNRPDSRIEAGESPIYVSGTNINLTRNKVAARKDVLNYTLPNNTRSLEGYQVYRLLEEDINSPENWDHLTEGGLVTDTTYVDDGWAALESGTYMWGVRAAYTNSNYSEFSFSNALPHNMTAPVTVNVTANTEESPQGAILTMANIDGDEEHVYEAVVPAGGSVYFPSVWLGLYTMTCELDGYDEYVENNVVVEDLTGEEFDIELTEALIAVVAGSGVVDGNDILLTWFAPGEGDADEFSEDFESGALGAGWEITGESTDESASIPGYFTVTDYSGTDYAPFGTYHTGLWWSYDHQDEWLITPEFNCGSTSSINWWSVCYEGSVNEDHYYLKASTDGGSTWDILWDASALTGNAWNYYDYAYDVDLSDYAGQSIKLAWNCVDGSGNDGLWYVFFVDNITIASDEDVITFDGADLTHETRNNKGKKEIARTDDRSLLGYKIVRNGTVIVQLQTDTEYIDVNLQSGTWTYLIYAVYTTGDADPFPLGPFIGTNGGNAPTYVTGLNGNHPNPFNPETEINFSLSSPDKVTIDIYNIRGQKVKSLVNDKYDAGDHKAVWNGTDDANHKVGSGVYFYKMKSGRYTATKKMILLK